MVDFPTIARASAGHRSVLCAPAGPRLLAGGGRSSVYIKHHGTPWYVVVLPGRSRHYVSSVNRFTLQVASVEELVEAHERFRTSGKDFGITEVMDPTPDNGGVSFVFSDFDQNWWELYVETQA